LSGTTHFTTDDLQQQLKLIANNPKFKYSRLFAIGVFTLLEPDSDLVKDEKQRVEALKQTSAALHMRTNSTRFRAGGNLEKMAQALTVMADMLS